MTALKYYDGSTWRTIGTVQGPQGPIGPVGPPGTVYDTDAIGTVKSFAGQNIPTGWMLADGRSLLRADYPDAYAVLGTVYGAVDAAHFNLPNLTDRFVYGASSPSVNGGLGGASTVTLDVTQIPAHSHPPASGSFFLTGTSGASQRDDGPGGLSAVTGGSSPTGNTGGGLAHPNMPPYILIAQIIKVIGVSVNPAGALVGPTGPAGSSITVPIEPWHVVGAAGEPAFQSPWTNYVAGSQVAMFRKFPDGKVKLTGYVKGGTTNTTIFTLPVGYRPVDQVGVATYVTNGVGLLTVDPDGAVKINGITGTLTTLTSLDAMEFDTESATTMPVGPMGPAGPGFRGIVASLPSLPADGDECYFQNAAMAAQGIVWHFRYRTAATPPYRWEFLGGPPLTASVVTVNGENTPAAYGAITTAGPSLTLPLGGDYDVYTRFSGYHGSAGGAVYMSYDIGATAAVDLDAIAVHDNVANIVNTAIRTKRKTALAAVTLTAKYKSSPVSGVVAGTNNIGGAARDMFVTPVRVG